MVLPHFRSTTHRSMSSSEARSSSTHGFQTMLLQRLPARGKAKRCPCRFRLPTPIGLRTGWSFLSGGPPEHDPTHLRMFSPATIRVKRLPSASPHCPLWWTLGACPCGGLFANDLVFVSARSSGSPTPEELVGGRGRVLACPSRPRSGAIAPPRTRVRVSWIGSLRERSCPAHGPSRREVLPSQRARHLRGLRGGDRLRARGHADRSSTQLGTEAFGIWSFIGSITLHLMVLDFGVGPSIIRFAAEARGRRLAEDTNALASVGLALYAVDRGSPPCRSGSRSPGWCQCS